ncbi:transcriptional regulator, TetR family [Haloechinothrix alba]|uniref:Transcriptional regulator, TetR family n=1 Tax=Haloechinothrix alba TaxID=664784 RepID=A0A238WQP0_9PSEU|nr:TetR/AcrR family transcriptional regulator [Haloechinothrix alba]SNR48876.1 transcriptional regulator, TetR family [Haloechinothrix alba]
MTRRPAPSGTGRSATRRSRQDPVQRREQLIGIGLEMLTRRPLHQITVDDVAAGAGISRSLLFHYFPTKRDYYAEVVRAASRRLLHAMWVREDSAGRAGTIEAILTEYLDFLERRHEPYLALLRSSGAEDWAREIFEETRAALAGKLIGALGIEQPSELERAAVTAWLSFAEELGLTWARHTIGDRAEVLRLLTGTLRRAVHLAGQRAESAR